MGKANPVVKGGESEGVILYCGGAFGGSITTMANIEKELLKEILSQDVEEEVYAGLVDDTSPVTTTYAKVASGTIPSGYEGIIMGIAVSFSETVDAYLKRKGKHVYADGLRCAALTNVAQGSGVGNEVPLLVRIGEKEEWEFGFKATTGTAKVNWRLRVRLFRKKAE